MKKTYFFPSVIVQFLLTVLFRVVPVLAPIPYASPLAAVTLAYAKANVLWGFAFSFCNILIVAMVRSYILQIEQFSASATLVVAFCYGICMGIAGVFLFQKRNQNYVRSVLYYLCIGFFALIVFDFLTGVVIPCANYEYSFSTQLALQLDWTLRHSVFNLVFVPLAPSIERWIEEHALLNNTIQVHAYG
ncbi:MAG: hypothetical protein MUD00_00180 [Candidatus Pacebacteria bacterium]|jgi:hypothetical protein|nr:hypothetical protein [Candidatus Paceibacterota bacterium]